MTTTSTKQVIPMVDLRTQYHQLKAEVQSAIDDVLESGVFISGPNVLALEGEIQHYLDVKHAVSCASGTDALHLALLALGIKAGDEVVTPAFTFAATAEAIRHVNAIPVFVDIDGASLNMDVACLEKAITLKTRAVIAVHLFGNPVNISDIRTAIAGRDIKIVEDCAQSFGSVINGKKTGTLGDIGCFSFYPSKNLGCYGDGGLVSTQDDSLAEKVKLHRNHGTTRRYHHTVVGFNSRLDEIQAAILRVKLQHVDEHNSRRRAVADRYSRRLRGVMEQIPTVTRNGTHVFHQYTMLTDNRKLLQKVLSENDIASEIYYPRGLHLQEAFADVTPVPSLPVTENVSARCISLPIYPELTFDQIDYICEVIISAFK
tara:strand:+ start:3827 stop:4945 length:1119 start_codon:yes stop_codon:yes gene_type:complete